jgi:glycosyltransferase involved in cell wall biosynthesis
MKVLFFTEDFAPVVGGVQTIVMELARGLVELPEPFKGDSGQPFDVTVATRTPAGDMDDSRFPFSVVREPSVIQLFDLFRDADVIHLAGASIVPMILGLLVRKPVVVEHHGYQSICPSGNYLHEPDKTICPGHFENGNYAECLRCELVESTYCRSIWNLTMLFPRRWLVKRVAANVAVSDHNGLRIALPRTQTIYHGIQDGVPQVARSSRTSTPLVLAYVGRLVPDKGVDVLLRGASEARSGGTEFRLKIIGDGPTRGQLEDLANQLQLEDCVIFYGYCQGNALQQVMADVSVVVMPSLWEEACPTAAIEEMMRGSLVIAADIGGLAEVVGSAGMKFPPGDASALAGCIKKVVNDRLLVASLGDAARERALGVFSKDRMVRKHVALYSELARRIRRGNA